MGAFTLLPQVRGPVEHAELVEASGIVASPSAASLLWAHNDSGDSPRLFAMGEGGENLGVVVVEDVPWVDVEDIAAAPCPDGEGPCLYIGDFGNNYGSRTDQAIYVIEEPRPDDERAKVKWLLPLDLQDPQIDVEALVVFPDASAIALIEKVDAPSARVFVAEGPFSDGRPARFVERGTIKSHGVDIGNGLMVTGADLHSTGQQLLVRTYAGVGLYSLQGADDLRNPSAVVGQRVVLGPIDEPQGEAVAFDRTGMGIWTVSEVAGGELHPPLHHFTCEYGMKQ